MIATIDRIIDKYAIVELDDKSMVNMPLQLLPKGAVEGDVIKITIDVEETKRRQVEINEMTKELFD